MSWSSFAQTPLMGAEYAVTADEYGRAVTPRPRQFASMEVMAMAKVIEVYLPTIFNKPLKGASQQQCAKVIEFYTQRRKSA